MKTLIIGGTGFIGKELVVKLITSGYRVSVMARHYVPDFPAKIIKGDIFNTLESEKILKTESPDIVFVASWITDKNNYRSSAENISYMNAVIDFALMVCSQKIRHLIVLGTCAEYGDNNKNCVAGSSRLIPLNLYSVSKAFTFLTLKEIFAGQQTALTWARIFQPYGKNQDSNRLIPYIKLQLEQDLAPILHNTYDTNDWITTRDIASALCSIIGPNPPVEIDVGTGISTYNFEIVNTLAKILNKEHLLFPLDDFDKSTNSKGLSVGRNSYLLMNKKNKWAPSDTMLTGLDWIINA